METIFFKESGDPLKFKLIVKNGILGVSYIFNLFNHKSKKLILSYNGNNYHEKEHFHYLPCPLNENNERILCLNADCCAFKANSEEKYLLALEVYQGKELINSIEKIGHLSTNEDAFLLDVQLKMLEN